MLANRSFIQSPKTIAVFVFLFLAWAAAAWPQQSGSGSMPDMPGMPHGMKMPPAVENAQTIAKQQADKRESEFNHRLAGVFVILAGAFAFWEPRLLDQRSSVARFGWGVCFLVAGLFLLVFSDTEIWPFGPQSPWYAIAHNPEDLQHKIFAVVLLGIGILQIQTARGRLKPELLAYMFPLMALAGSILLVFHTHSGDMSAANAMETMKRVKAQHARFAATGVAIALTSVLAVKPQRYQRLWKKAWPLLLILLGVLLLLYTE